MVAISTGLERSCHGVMDPGLRRVPENGRRQNSFIRSTRGGCRPRSQSGRGAVRAPPVQALGCCPRAPRPRHCQDLAFCLTRCGGDRGPAPPTTWYSESESRGASSWTATKVNSASVTLTLAPWPGATPQPRIERDRCPPEALESVCSRRCRRHAPAAEKAMFETATVTTVRSVRGRRHLAGRIHQRHDPAPKISPWDAVGRHRKVREASSPSVGRVPLPFSVTLTPSPEAAATKSTGLRHARRRAVMLRCII